MTPFSAVLFDRDGTLVADVPYNGDPERVRLLPGAAEAVALARALGLATGVVSNQSGVGRGLITADDVRRVNERADALLGGLDTWVFCPHTPETGCDCRKPRPGLIRTAAARLGVPPAACLVIGDIAADVLAARAAGAHALLVPNPATAPAEVARFADQSAPDVLTAIRTALTGAANPAGERLSSEDAATAGEGAWPPPRHAEAPERAWPPPRRAAAPDRTRPSSSDAAAPDRAWPSSLGATSPDRTCSSSPNATAVGWAWRSAPDMWDVGRARGSVPDSAGAGRGRSG
ncbi:HAD-IIIA family hydrolase [Streptomyces puniciscabiei]|uniref:HAD-IIIA family hydrolase n=1 Tax=Streptomyces puniciscabiei TaxID=164348 RepID=UPI0037AF52F3